eukprot:TRINITY_DN21927_c0_g1_i1.p1 TRINITY_DN21927_c0_g1~~TRINITY_DN21927_c0_g1_i1.p1  ORF type:complete len:331 (-),score=26.39 TRINITY_DN21927_c0_g1_i1:88-1080(-)
MEVKYGPEYGLQIFDDQGNKKKHRLVANLKELRETIHQETKSCSRLRRIEIQIPQVPRGITFVDTPGLFEPLSNWRKEWLPDIIRKQIDSYKIESFVAHYILRSRGGVDSHSVNEFTKEFANENFVPRKADFEKLPPTVLLFVSQGQELSEQESRWLHKAAPGRMIFTGQVVTHFQNQDRVCNKMRSSQASETEQPIANIKEFTLETFKRRMQYGHAVFCPPYLGDSGSGISSIPLQLCSNRPTGSFPAPPPCEQTPGIGLLKPSLIFGRKFSIELKDRSSLSSVSMVAIVWSAWMLWPGFRPIRPVRSCSLSGTSCISCKRIVRLWTVR